MKCLKSSNDTVGMKIRRECVKETTRFMLIVLASVLTDKYGFGKVKVQQVMKSIIDRADSINQGYIDLSDLEQILKDEYGIEVR